MSLTERIIVTIEDARARRASDQEIDRALIRIGCTRIVRRSRMMIVYYDDHGVERFIILSGPVIEEQVGQQDVC
jgi:hypothetical protein